MALPELKELKEQLQDFLDKGFYRPSISPWVAFLGHVVSANGIQVAPKKIETVKDWPSVGPRTEWVILQEKNAEGVDVPKTRDDFTAEDLKKWEKNAKANKWLVCGLGPYEYNMIQSCTTSKDIWDTLQVAHEGTPQVKRSRGTLKIILEEDKVEKILKRVLPVTWESKITVIQESKNIAILKLDELIGNLTACELIRPTMKMDAPKKERSLALRIDEGADLEDDEMGMITTDFKKYLIRGKCSSRGTTFNKPRVPEKQTNEGCYKYGKTDHMIKNCSKWEIEWRKERAKRRNRKKEQV
ncbi:uncharacterized protein [Nicotiana sylvestris]|uniref:uncharacterized protein n=1 Tax=Nicotiana sylvestris TaxID=4096 RepID=UPI00388CA014